MQVAAIFMAILKQGIVQQKNVLEQSKLNEALKRVSMTGSSCSLLRFAMRKKLYTYAKRDIFQLTNMKLASI